MPGSFVDQRERSNEELKTKGRIESERQWGSKVKGSSAMQNISKWMASLWKGYVNLCLQMGRDRLPFYELNKSSLVYSQAEGQGPLRQAMKYDYNNKSNKKQVKETVYNMDWELTSSLQHCRSLSHNLVEKKGFWPFCLVRWIFLGVSAIFASVSNIEICLLFVPLWKCLISHL